MSSAAPFVLDAPLNILYQDQHLVAVDKPSGMLVHRSFLDKHETVFVMQSLRDQIGQHVFPVHRLDRPTSGVLLFALSADVGIDAGGSMLSGLSAVRESCSFPSLSHALPRAPACSRRRLSWPSERASRGHS